MDPGEKRDTTVNITDNPAFSYDAYDVIPGQYLNNNKPTALPKYLLPKRGSLGKVKYHMCNFLQILVYFVLVILLAIAELH